MLCAGDDKGAVSIPLTTSVLCGLGQVACPLWAIVPHYESAVSLGSSLNELLVSQGKPEACASRIVVSWEPFWGDLLCARELGGFRNKPHRIYAPWGSCTPT